MAQTIKPENKRPEVAHILYKHNSFFTSNFNVKAEKSLNATLTLTYKFNLNTPYLML